MADSCYALISEQEFFADWKTHAKPNGELFTYQEAICSQVSHVWTVYEDGIIDEQGYDDCTWFAMPGIVPSMAVGYLLSEKEWRSDTPHAIWYLDDDDAAREERRIFNLENGLV